MFHEKSICASSPLNTIKIHVDFSTTKMQRLFFFVACLQMSEKDVVPSCGTPPEEGEYDVPLFSIGPSRYTKELSTKPIVSEARTLRYGLVKMGLPDMLRQHKPLAEHKNRKLKKPHKC